MPEQTALGLMREPTISGCDSYFSSRARKPVIYQIFPLPRSCIHMTHTLDADGRLYPYTGISHTFIVDQAKRSLLSTTWAVAISRTGPGRKLQIPYSQWRTRFAGSRAKIWARDVSLWSRNRLWRWSSFRGPCLCSTDAKCRDVRAFW